LTGGADRATGAGMGRALFLSIAQLGDRAVLGVLTRSLAVTLAILLAIGAGWWFALDAGFEWVSGEPDRHGYLMALAIILAFLSGWLLFRVIAIGVLGIFADGVVEAVERRHYPDAALKARPLPFARAMRMSVVSGVRAVLVNILVLPAAAGLVLTGVGMPLLFLLANGWLLGRDLGDMVAVRHLPRGELPGWRRDTRVPRFVLGLGIAALLLVPVLGLLAPVLGAALATHLFHRRST
jgi:CysZ protein